MSSPNEEKLTLTEAFKDNVLYRRSIFITNFLAIIPSARLFKFASNQLSHHRSNEILEGLLDVALNNFVELVITIIALAYGQIRVVQAALEQDFSSSSTAVQADSSVLTLACISLILPASFSLFVNQNDPNANDDAIYPILLVGSINGVVESNKISKTFIGVILLPIVGHIAKYINIFYIGSEDNKDNKEKTTESEEKMENEEKTTEMMECEKMMAAKTVNSIRSSIVS
ncbi:6344_t:CDS:2 [Gigaspora rosea]|nr:6344_t:CDS:2 [Gigaspora rosea]